MTRSVQIVAGSDDVARGVAGKRELRGVADEGWHELGRWRQRGCCGWELCEAVPSHGEVLAVGGVQCGGARG